MAAVSIKVSVVTPTIRGTQALRPVEQSLDAQGFRDFEWLVEIGDGKVHDLNAAFNRMLRRARGELVVFWEDYQWVYPNGLLNFWQAHEVKPVDFFTAPVTKCTGFIDHGYGRLSPAGPYEKEWRSNDPQRPQEVDHFHWECDWAAAPLSALKEVGGFDESLDAYWGNDNGNVAFRAIKAGHRCWNLGHNPAVALKHDELWPHPFRDNYNPEFNFDRLKQFEAGLKLEFK